MKKTWGIIGAMEVEVADLKRQLDLNEVHKIASMYFYDGIYEGRRVIVVRSGVGKVNAAICAQILVDKFNCKAIINTGIAGSLRNEIDIADIVVSTEALQHDMDAVDFGYERGVIPQMKVSTFRACEILRGIAVDACKNHLKDTKVYEGRVLTGDQFVSKDDKKAELLEMFDGYCTEMEGAAIAQAAYLNKVPFVIIRAISDKADGSATMDYPEFEKLAAQRSVKLVTQMLKNARD